MGTYPNGTLTTWREWFWKHHSSSHPPSRLVRTLVGPCGARLRAVNLSAETITPMNSPCPSWARPQPRASHQRHQRLTPQREPSLNRAYSVHPQPQPPLALKPTYVVFGRQVEALRSAETLPARRPPFLRVSYLLQARVKVIDGEPVFEQREYFAR